MDLSFPLDQSIHLTSDDTASPRTPPPPEVNRGISLDSTPFDIETCDLDVLLETASTDKQPYNEDYESDISESDDLFDALECFDEALPSTTTTMVPSAEITCMGGIDDPSFFTSMFSLFRSSTPTVVDFAADRSAPSTPPTHPTHPTAASTRTSRDESDGNNESSTKPSSPSMKKSNAGSSSTKVVDPKRIEARLASQKYREAKNKEYNDALSRNQTLKNDNIQARQELIYRGDQISLVPPLVPADSIAHLVLPATWNRAETRKERNRQAAKRSRDAAKNKLKILVIENEHLRKDNFMLQERLRSVQNNKRIAGVADDKEDLLRKRRNTAPNRPSSFVLSEHALLLLSCLCLFLGCTFQASEENQNEQQQQPNTGMDLSAGLMQHANFDDTHPVPLLAAGLVCVCSVAVAAFSFSSSSPKVVG